MSKQTKKKDTSHYFIDGFQPRKDLLGIVAYPNALKGTDTEVTTFYMAEPGDWVHQKYDFEGRGVVATWGGKANAWWVLGKRGEVVEFSPNGSRQEQIADAGTGGNKLGYVEKLALIDGELYVCGYRRQVYRRQANQWVHIDGGMLAPKSEKIGFESMDGTSGRDIYAAGDEGQIWHFDGKRWDEIDSPTNVNLHEIHCVSPQLTYAVGASGVVVRGAGSRWEVLQDEDREDDLWGVTSFNGTIYVAGFGGIARIDGNKIVPVDTGLGKIEGYRLRSGFGLLWSIGNDRILRFDGKAWTELACPDNP